MLSRDKNMKKLIVICAVFILTDFVVADINLSLAAWWDFNEGAGNTLYDRSGNGNNGTIYGATWQEGITGKALFFDGVNDYVNIGNKFNDLKLPITITAWVKKGWSDTTEHPIFYSDIGYYYYGFKLYVKSNTTTDVLHAGYGDGGYPAPDSRRGKTAWPLFSTNEWIFVSAVIKSSSNINLYVNGTDVGGSYYGTGGGMVHSSGVARIGRGGWMDASPWFKGSIDELRIYSRALDITEVQELRWLHNNNTVINIDATLYGDPGAGLNTLKVPFSEGYYVSTFINPSIDSRALYTAWSAWSEGDSWYSYYGIKVGQITFAGGDHIGGSSPEGVFELVEPKTISFYVPQDMDVEFYIGDNNIGDNRGGVSLLIKKTIPGDVNGDLGIDLMDFAVFSSAWLSSNGGPSFNWRCDTTFDNIVDANDISALTSDWLKDVLP